MAPLPPGSTTFVTPNASKSQLVSKILFFPHQLKSLASRIVSHTLRVEKKQIIFMFITVVIVVIGYLDEV